MRIISHSWLAVLLLSPTTALSQSTWDRYVPGSFTAIIERERPALVRDIQAGRTPMTRISGATFPTRAIVHYQDSIRPTSPVHLELLTAWARSLRLSADVATMFQSEILVREDTLALWLPTQAALIAAMREELRRGDRVMLFAGYVGAAARDSTTMDFAFVVNEFEKQ